MAVVLIIISTGCDFGNGYGSNGNDEAIWKAYSTYNFGIKYPGEWSVYQTTEWMDGYGMADLFLFSEVEGEEARPYFYIFSFDGQLEGLTESEKAEFIALLGDAYAEEIYKDDNDILLDTSNTILDGQSAYKILIIRYKYQEENSKEKLIISYYNDDIYFLSFADKETNYNNSIEIGNRMLDSFEFLR